MKISDQSEHSPKTQLKPCFLSGDYGQQIVNGHNSHFIMGVMAKNTRHNPHNYSVEIVSRHQIIYINKWKICKA